MSDEARKKLIYLVAGMFLCRKLDALELRPSPAREMAFRNAIEMATELMRRVEARFPSNRHFFRANFELNVAPHRSGSAILRRLKGTLDEESEIRMPQPEAALVEHI